MRDPERSDNKRRSLPFTIKKHASKPRRGDMHDPERFEVQKRDERGLVASVVFTTERQALNFAGSLTRLMARTGERGSVEIVWPHPTT